MSGAAAIIFVEHVLWHPRRDWDAALEHLSERFCRSSPFDAEAVRDAGALHVQLERLASWAAESGVDLERELGRWFDEHLSMHVRPDPATTRAVRLRASRQALHAASALPPRAAESIMRHAGCWRSCASLTGDVRSADDLARVASLLDASEVIAASPTPVPDGVSVASP